MTETPAEALKAEARPYPDLLSEEEQKVLLTRAEELWVDLQANRLGGFSGINRPFWIVHEFKRVIEAFGRRDVGLRWSKDDLAATPSPAPDAGEVRTYREGVFKEGWLLMPIEPTPEMIAAAWGVVTEAKNARNIQRLGPGVGTVDVYRAMVAAIRKLP